MASSSAGSDTHCSEGIRDPVTVLVQPLTVITSKLKSLTVEGDPNEPTTPTSDSPMSGLDRSLRNFVDEQLGSLAEEPRVYMKILVSNAAAGCIIGKGGHHVNRIQSKTSAKIKLSKSSESLPYTKERIILISGTIKQVVAALDVTVKKLIHEQQSLDYLSHHQAFKSNSSGLITPPTSLAYVGGGGGESSFENSGAASVCSFPLSDTATTAANNGSKIKFKLKLLVPTALLQVMQGNDGRHVTAAQFTHQVKINVYQKPSHLPSLQRHKVTIIIGEPSNVIKAAACLMLSQTSHPEYDQYNELPMPSPSLHNSPGHDCDDIYNNQQSYYYHQEQLNYYNYYYQQQPAAAIGGYHAAGGLIATDGGYFVDDTTAWAMQQQQQQQYQAYYYGNHNAMYSSPVAAMYSSPLMNPSSLSPTMSHSPNSSKQQYPAGVESEILVKKGDGTTTQLVNA